MLSFVFVSPCKLETSEQSCVSYGDVEMSEKRQETDHIQVFLIMAFRKLERGSGKECFSHTLEETNRPTARCHSEISFNINGLRLENGKYIWMFKKYPASDLIWTSLHLSLIHPTIYESFIAVHCQKDSLMMTHECCFGWHTAVRYRPG